MHFTLPSFIRFPASAPAGRPARAAAGYIAHALARLCVGLLGLGAPGAFALNSADKPADYIAAHWDTEDGLPHNSIKQLFQTRDGYLWIGTGYGLVRFDGLTFTVFDSHNTPQIPNSQITSLAETSDGSLWFGTSEALVRYFGGRFTAFTQADGVRSITINSVCVAADGSLWIGGQLGITRWVDGKFVNDIDTSAFDTLGLRTIFRDRQNAMWIANGSEALRYRNGTFARFGRAQGLVANRVENIREDPDGHIVAVTQSGLFVMEGERFAPFEYNGDLSSLRASTAIVDRVGNFWVGTTGGLDRFVDGKVLPYLDRSGRKLGVVDGLLEDRESCLWVGTSEGLYRLTDRRAYSLSTEDGLSANLIDSVMQSRDGSLWVGSWGGGVDRFQDNAVTHYKSGAPLSHETVTRIYEAPDGAMWLGNRGSSVDRLEGNKVTTYVYEPGVTTSRPVTAMIDDGGTLLIGIDKRGLLELRNGQITPVPEFAEWATNRNVTVWTLFRTRDGRMLMGTSHGLYERDTDQVWQRLPFSDLKGTLEVRSILEETDGTLWFATDGHGLVRWKNGQARSFGSREGMLADSLFTVLDDNQGSFWVGSARGLGRIRKTEFDEIDRNANVTLNCMTFGRVDGLLSASISGSGGPISCRLSDGRLMFATAQGVAVIDPSTLLANSQPPTLVIESIVADDRPQAVGKSVILSAGTSKLEIRYTALSLIAPLRLRFRYQLVGSDLHWVEAGRERFARYTHLAPGNYTFHVLACNNDGVWNETGTTLAVTMLPQYFETLWFRLAVLVVAVVAIALLVRLRLRQLDQRQAALTRMNAELDLRVRKRTTELSQSNDELQQRELLFRLIFEHAPVGILWKRADLGADYHLNSTFRRILDLPTDTLPDQSRLTKMLHPDDERVQALLDLKIESRKTDSYTVEQRYIRHDGAVVWGLLSVAVIRDAQGRIIQDIGILEDITARKKAEQQLADTYKNLVEVSRTAGMAEVATGVLHNVGNVLNSLNVSATIVATGLRESKADSLARLSALLHEHSADLATFLTADPKGRRVPEFIASLAKHSTEERDRLLGETLSLQQNVDHIKEIVSMQQAYATMVGIVEPLDPVMLVEDALRMNAGALVRHGLHVQRDFQPAPWVIAEKAKVLQILINLIRNAKYACDDGGGPDKIITLAIEPAPDDRVQIIVRDNGIGIPVENLTRIFAHGFTTRKSGHGFGLHSAANAAKEMKGSLTVRSDGSGFGATFILELPALTEDTAIPSGDSTVPEPKGESAGAVA
jgi:PAS domain S-box-containing protein